MDYVRWADRALEYRAAWIARVENFRQFLSGEGKSNVDLDIPLQDAPYRKASMEVSGKKEKGNWKRPKYQAPPDLTQNPPGVDHIEYRERYMHCIDKPDDCGDKQSCRVRYRVSSACQSGSLQLHVANFRVHTAAYCLSQRNSIGYERFLVVW